ncbi:mechanosensitive ion channel family protein [Chitinophaga japonensis]|uniref:Small-conductance mechanosensitive channel n=1 Tax=Chitinophaga japonensis TaxID=104662 RepID=A0A562TDK4_CHIJA|nr:mechanosensitive ion channel family protein [Chitinophaga japonensis]TWI91334.1 small-conductance mechanosensitive channel [Chitinophaga japonensis]
MPEVLQYKFWGNTLLSYVIALGILLLAIVLIMILKRIILSRMKVWADKTDNKIDDFLIGGIERSLIPLLYVGAIYIAFGHLNMVPVVRKWFNILISVAITFYLVRAVVAALKFMLMGYMSRQQNGEEKTKQVRGIMIIATAFVWVIGGLVLLSNWGVDVTAFIAGLGIGGIAIALAAQTILGDLFSYFVIFFDRPFEIGDFIIVQDKMGVVEYIGIKTTRIRSLSGEQLVFSNTDLTNSRVHNYKRMERRRIVFQFRVVYQTPAEKLERIPVIVKEIITGREGLQFDRAHLLSLAPSELLYEVVYYVLTGDYNEYMDHQQAINLALFNTFAKEGIEFAYPTQTLYVQQLQQEKEAAAAK